MTKYFSCAETAKLVRKALKENFKGVKFSVRSSVYAGGASISVGWLDGPTVKKVEKVAKPFQGATFDSSIDLKSYVYAEIDGEEVQFGADYVMCNRHLSRNFVTAILEQFCKRRGIAADKIKIQGRDENDAWVDSRDLDYWEENNLNALLRNTDIKDMHRAYEAEEEREKAEHEEWVRNEPQRRAQQESEEAERLREEEANRQREREQQERMRRDQERRSRESFQQSQRSVLISREKALAYLGLSVWATTADINKAFKAKVREAADGKGGYKGDMDFLVKVKERALQ